MSKRVTQRVEFFPLVDHEKQAIGALLPVERADDQVTQLDVAARELLGEPLRHADPLDIADVGLHERQKTVRQCPDRAVLRYHADEVPDGTTFSAAPQPGNQARMDN